MDIEVAINLVDKLVFQETNQHLSSIRVNLLRGVWSNQSYEELAEICYCSVSHVKMLGSNFWQELSQILGEKVTKKTVRAILESYYQDLKAGKLRKISLNSSKDSNLCEKTNNTKIIPSQAIPDLWFGSEMLLRLTERLDDSLKTIYKANNGDPGAIESLSEKLRLIHDLSAEKYSPHFTASDLIKICRALIEGFKVQFPQRTITLSLLEEPVLPDYDVAIDAVVDEKLLRNILTNLLSNSLKYSDRESPIILDINLENGRGIFTLTDGGIGINIDELELVFKPFYRGRNARQISGHGLGLTIVEKSVRSHQGELFVASQVREGSTVTVVLPVV